MLTNRRPRLLEATAASERKKALGERFRRYPRSRTRSSRSNLPSNRALNPTRSACVETSTGGLPLSPLYSSTYARALSSHCPFNQMRQVNRAERIVFSKSANVRSMPNETPKSATHQAIEQLIESMSPDDRARLGPAAAAPPRREPRRRRAGLR